MRGIVLAPSHSALSLVHIQKAGHLGCLSLLPSISVIKHTMQLRKVRIPLKYPILIDPAALL